MVNKEIKKTDELEAQISAINKEISNLKFEIFTKNQHLSINKDRVQPLSINEVLKELQKM